MEINGDSFVQQLLWAKHQARIWYNFTTPDGPPNRLHHGYFQEGSQVPPTPQTKYAQNSFKDFLPAETSENELDS